MKLPIAVQLYSVRKDCQQDLFGVLKQVAEMGYDGVEFAGYYGHGAAEIKKSLDDFGLKAEGTHTGLPDFEPDKFAATVETHHILGAKFAIVPWIAEDLRNSEESCLKTAEKLTELTHKLAEVGLQTGFHCHEGDMRPLAGGKSAWDILAANTPSEFLLQYDTANGMSGGADPIKPILDWPGRSVSVHLKAPDGELIGDKGIDWGGVFEACETVGKTEWYVVEHEEEGGLTPIEAIRKSLENLRALGK